MIIRAPVLQRIILEDAVAVELGRWDEVQRVVGLGKETGVIVLLTHGPGPETRFWRARFE